MAFGMRLPVRTPAVKDGQNVVDHAHAKKEFNFKTSFKCLFCSLTIAKRHHYLSYRYAHQPPLCVGQIHYGIRGINGISLNR